MDSTEEKEKNTLSLRRLFLVCPVRHVILLISAAITAAYFLLRHDHRLMQTVCRNFVRPYHALMSRLCSAVDFSVSGVCIALFVLAVSAYLLISVVMLIRRRADIKKRLWRLFITVFALVFAVYALFCLLWGVYYYASDFQTDSGITAKPAATEQLESVTKYFAGLLNEYGDKVSRGGDGVFAEPLDEIFARSASLYDNVQTSFPCLSGQDIPAKRFMFSRAMSLVNFTGFFFPFTGEANINIDAPACYIPSTIAHELAHQRGVAREDEANFVAVLASLASGDDVYIYSACLLAYTHLGNALHSADYDAWLDVYSGLSDGVKADIAENNAYWQQFETPVSTVSDNVYTGFLKSYGQTQGLKTYGRCVDLLIAYYYEISVQE